WDMLERNSDSCWFATSRSRLFSSISRNRFALAMATFDWLASALIRFTMRSPNSPGLRRPTPLARAAPDPPDAARHVAAAAHGHGQHRSESLPEEDGPERVVVGLLHVRDLHRLPGLRGPADRAVGAPDRHGEDRVDELGGEPLAHDHVEGLPSGTELEDPAAVRV